VNTRKQVFLMTALILVALITLGIYGAWDPSRADTAEEQFEEHSIERAARIFGQNCRLCHGDVGQGGALGARLAAAPALDRPDLQGFIDLDASLLEDAGPGVSQLRVSNAYAFRDDQVVLINDEKMLVTAVAADADQPVTPTPASQGEEAEEPAPIPGTLTVSRAYSHTEEESHFAEDEILGLDAATLRQQQTLITNTITCGRVGTAMPPWAQTQNGPLSDEQIRQLMTLITTGRWDFVAEEVDVEDRITADLLAAIAAEDTSIQVSDVSVFSEGAAIRIGPERLRIVSVPEFDPQSSERPGTIEVERGVLQTTPFEHAQDAELFRFPETSEPAILQQSCGQTARAPAPSEPPGLIEPFEGQTVEVVAFGIAFDTDEITVQADGQVRVRLDNQDAATQHNIAFYASESDLTPVSDGAVGTIFEGPEVDDTVFDIPAAGEYFFRCDVHPTQMTGAFIVE
jgi:plastocyanin